MLRRLCPLERYGVGLFGSYLLLFLAMHTPLRHAGVGILARQPANYLTIAKTINPLALLNTHLGWLGGKAARFEELSIYIMLFLIYILAVRKMRQTPPSTCRRSIIITGIALFSLPLFALPFIPDQDIYSYIIYGRMAAAHGANPATTVPSDFPQDPFFQFLGVWRSLPSVYGPLWMRFSEGLTFILPSSSAALWLYLLAYKLAAVIFHSMNTLLIWSILGRWKPEQQGWGTLLYAWNPVMLIHFAGSGHNDALIVCMLLLTIWLVQREHWRAGVITLVSAALVKWIFVALVPLYVLYVMLNQQTWRARLSIASQVSGIAIMWTVLLYAPYWDGGAVVRPLLTNPSASLTANSLGAFVVDQGPQMMYRLGLGPKPLPWRFVITPFTEQVIATYRTVATERRIMLQVVNSFSKGIFLVAWLIAAVALWRRPTFTVFIQCCFWTLFTLLLVTTWFWPWYLSWPLALAALLDWQKAGRTMIIFTCTTALIYLPIRSIQSVANLLIFLPVIAFLLYQLWRDRQMTHRGSTGTHAETYSGQPSVAA